ncbi:MAG: 30S ribosomal protein S18 [Planctomycetota bacterium]
MKKKDGKRKRKAKVFAPKKCRFCTERIYEIDYKNVDNLQKLTTLQGKMFSRKRSGNCAWHQRLVKRAVKRARFLALLSYGR